MKLLVLLGCIYPTKGNECQEIFGGINDLHLSGKQTKRVHIMGVMILLKLLSQLNLRLSEIMVFCSLPSKTKFQQLPLSHAFPSVLFWSITVELWNTILVYLILLFSLKCHINTKKIPWKNGAEYSYTTLYRIRRRFLSIYDKVEFDEDRFSFRNRFRTQCGDEE